jgi:hypothetical protein
MKALLLPPLLLSLLLTSCTVSNKDWNVALGGKGAYSGRDFSVTWDNEKSFSDGAIIAGLAVGAAQAVAAQRSADSLAKTVNSNATKQAISASKDATAVQLGEQAVEVQKAQLVAP